MRRALIPVLLLVLVSIVLAATVFQEEVARAGPASTEIFVADAMLAVQQEVGEEPIQRLLRWPFRARRQVETATFIVPAGKRLRIDLVTFHDLNRRVGINRFTVRTVVGGIVAFHYLSSSTQGNNGDVITETVEIYADPGTSVRFTALLSGPPGRVTIIGSFSGVLIDAS